MKEIICFLSKLKIPANKISIEHYYPKCLLPPRIYSLNDNIFLAHKTLNHIKADLPPCVWEEQKYKLTFQAIEYYHLPKKDKEFLERAIENWKTFEIDCCKFCVANKYKKYCVKYR